MKSLILTTVKVFALLSLMTGVIYPAVVTLGAGALFSAKAGGSLVTLDGKIVGSSLIAQKFQSDRYFWARPSASDYGTLPSGAGNLGPTSQSLKEAIADRKQKGLSGEMLFASGSGLDPHISLNAALSQLPRIVQARQMGENDSASLKELVNSAVEGRDFGFLGEERVNVLKLNLALDKR